MLKRIWKFICEMALVGGALLAFFALGGVIGQLSTQALAVTAALIAFTWGMMIYCATLNESGAGRDD